VGERAFANRSYHFSGTSLPHVSEPNTASFEPEPDHPRRDPDTYFATKHPTLQGTISSKTPLPQFLGTNHSLTVSASAHPTPPLLVLFPDKEGHDIDKYRPVAKLHLDTSDTALPLRPGDFHCLYSRATPIAILPSWMQLSAAGPGERGCVHIRAY